MTHEGQGIFVLNSCTRKKQPDRQLLEVLRGNYRFILFSGEDGTSSAVCGTFFLTTLGFHKASNKVLHNILSKAELRSIVPKPDCHVKGVAVNKFDRALLRDHVNSFHPCIFIIVVSMPLNESTCHLILLLSLCMTISVPNML